MSENRKKHDALACLTDWLNNGAQLLDEEIVESLSDEDYDERKTAKEAAPFAASENQVSGNRIADGDLDTECGLVCCCPGKVVAEQSVQLLDKAGAVTAVCEGIAAPHIGTSDVFRCLAEDLCADTAQARALPHGVEGIIKGLIVFGDNDFLGSGHVCLTLFLNDILSSLTCRKTGGGNKSADVSGFHIDPFVVGLQDHIAKAAGSQMADLTGSGFRPLHDGRVNIRYGIIFVYYCRFCRAAPVGEGKALRSGNGFVSEGKLPFKALFLFISCHVRESGDIVFQVCQDILCILPGGKLVGTPISRESSAISSRIETAAAAKAGSFLTV